jgi:CheY-like chemotaxis protein
MVDMPRVILIVEDDPSLLTLIAGILTDEGYEVVEAKNGQVGLNALTRGQPDLVLLDWNMPVMNGRAFLERASQEYPEVPVVIMTATYRIDSLAADLPVAGILAKPFDLETLLDTIARFTQPS